MQRRDRELEYARSIANNDLEAVSTRQQELANAVSRWATEVKTFRWFWDPRYFPRSYKENKLIAALNAFERGYSDQISAYCAGYPDDTA